MRPAARFFCLLLLLLPLLAACDDGSSVDPPPAEAGYHGEVEALLSQGCANCHYEGGIGPFALETHAQVAAVAPLVRQVLLDGRMPPWPPAAAGTLPMANDPTFSPEDVAVIVDWIDRGAPLGEPTDAPVEQPPGGLLRVDLIAEVPEPYALTGGPDEYRCFVLDWPVDQKRYVTGLDVVPGNPAIAHHAALFVVPPSNVPIVEGFDADEPGLGYRCFGGPAALGAPQVQVANLGGWAPGAVAVEFPSGSGVAVEPGSKLVLQMHYFATDWQGQSDRTRLDFTLAETVEREATYGLWFDLDWVLVPGAMHIPAGESDVAHGYETTLGEGSGFRFISSGRQFPDGVLLHTVAPHMHTLGRSIRVWVQRADGERIDVITIPEWDFDWQLEYRLAAPLAVAPDDTVGIECAWSAATVAEDVGWGEGTGDEMCIAQFYVTPLDGR